jgi:hypothetical protein
MFFTRPIEKMDSRLFFVIPGLDEPAPKYAWESSDSAFFSLRTNSCVANFNSSSRRMPTGVYPYSTRGRHDEGEFLLHDRKNLADVAFFKRIEVPPFDGQGAETGRFHNTSQKPSV